jgi:hypothetical protein
MGYACPVCETPQADGEHLANHLAFTAMLGREDHEAWLDDHAPDWEESNPEDLAETVVEAVPETEFPQMFEDTTEQHEHGHDHGAAAPDDAPFEQQLARQSGGAGRGDLTAETRDVLAEAREMTEQMLDQDEDASGEEDAEGDADASADGGADTSSGEDADAPADGDESGTGNDNG